MALSKITNTGINNITVDSGGNVGIGTSSPSTNLHISATGTPVFRIQDADGSDYYAQILQATGNTIFDSRFGASNGAFIFRGLGGGVADEYMRITSAGNVGIGTSSPSRPLHLVSSGTTTPMRIDSGTSAASLIDFKDTATTADFKVRVGSAGDNFVAYAGGSERLRIDSSGGISKNGSFSYSGTSDDFYWNTGTGDRFRFHSGTTSSRDILGFSNPNGVVGAIETNGSSTTYLTSSDYRLKENVTADWDATTRLKQLNPVRFNFIVDADTTVDGFLAHEVQDIVPEAITGTKDAVDDEGNPEYQGIDQSKLVPLLVKTIQELEARITALEAN